MSEKDNSITVERLVGEVMPRLPTPSKIPLATIGEVRREAAKVYRDCRQGRLDTAEGSRLSYMLAQIGKMILDSELEERISKLERMKNGNA